MHGVGAFSVKGPIGFFLFTDIMNGALYRNVIMGKNWIFRKLRKPRNFLCNSMSRRLEDVIAGNGNKINY